MMRRRTLLITVIAVFLGIAAVSAFAVAMYSTMVNQGEGALMAMSSEERLFADSTLSLLRPGMDYQDVISVLGPPDRPNPLRPSWIGPGGVPWSQVMVYFDAAGVRKLRWLKFGSFLYEPSSAQRGWQTSRQPAGALPPGSDSEAHAFQVADGPLEFEFPPGWSESTRQHPFDLQCESRDRQMSTGVFVYSPDYLDEDEEPRDLLDWQVDDFMSKHDNLRIVQSERVDSLEGKTLTSVVYTEDKGRLHYYYRFSLVEFVDHPELIPVTLQVAITGDWSEARSTLEAITESARIGSPTSVDSGNAH